MIDETIETEDYSLSFDHTKDHEDPWMICTATLCLKKSPRVMIEDFYYKPITTPERAEEHCVRAIIKRLREY